MKTEDQLTARYFGPYNKKGAFNSAKVQQCRNCKCSTVPKIDDFRLGTLELRHL